MAWLQQVLNHLLSELRNGLIPGGGQGALGQVGEDQPQMFLLGQVTSLLPIHTTGGGLWIFLVDVARTSAVFVSAHGSKTTSGSPDDS